MLDANRTLVSEPELIKIESDSPEMWISSFHFYSYDLTHGGCLGGGWMLEAHLRYDFQFPYRGRREQKVRTVILHIIDVKYLL